EILRKIQNKKRHTAETLNDAFSVVRGLENHEEIKKWYKWIRSETKKIPTVEMYDLTYKTYLVEAMKSDFDAYCIYLGKSREAEKKSYLPRRDVLLPLVMNLQDLFEGKIDFLGISLPPRVGKSTLCIFFATLVMGHHPTVASKGAFEVFV
ncbi:MAG: hypothetical protein IJF10_02315, partial [Clostridia bacterium]|nr:hypothetical protein [Clostridia bacterium]